MRRITMWCGNNKMRWHTFEQSAVGRKTSCDIAPKRPEPITTVEFVKGRDQTAPIVMAVTVESTE